MGPEGIDIHGDGQGSTGAMAERDRKNRRCKLRVRWLDTTERGAPVCMPMGRGRERKDEGTNIRGCRMVRGGGEVPGVSATCI